LIDRGHEVGGGDSRTLVGTVARMVQVAELGDGRYALMTIGTRRIRVTAWAPDDPYPLADVEDWPDDASRLSYDDLSSLVSTTFGRVRRINALASELGEQSVDVMAEISADPLLASYHLSNLAPIGPSDRQRLLEAAGPDERLAVLAEALDDAEAFLRFRLQHPSNGASGESGDQGNGDDRLDFGEP
jgi:Lon protease-like protein